MNTCCKIRLAIPALLVLSLFPSAFSALAADSHAHKEKPKIMIMMGERVGLSGSTGFEEPNQAEITMMQKFQDLGFIVVDTATVRENIKRSHTLRLLAGDNKAAAVTGLKFGAQYSIVGKAISKVTGTPLYGTQMKSIHATLTARVIRNDDAMVIASGSARATQAYIDEVQGGVMAIEKAAVELADDLAVKITAKWEKQARSASHGITLNITGLYSYRHLDYIMNFLEKKVAGVKAVHMRSFSEGIAELGLDYRGRMRELASQLSKQRFIGFRLQPSHVTPNRMDIKAVLQRRP